MVASKIQVGEFGLSSKLLIWAFASQQPQ
jgi:hypothetical protein